MRPESVPISWSTAESRCKRTRVRSGTDKLAAEVLRYPTANENLERIGNVIETNMVDVGQELIRREIGGSVENPG